MPTYEWRCGKCGIRVEKYFKRIITNEEKTIKCEECGGDAELQTFSPNCIKFCEKGHYIQDRGFNNESSEYNFALKKDREEKHEKI